MNHAETHEVADSHAKMELMRAAQEKHQRDQIWILTSSFDQIFKDIKMVHTTLEEPPNISALQHVFCTKCTTNQMVFVIQLADQLALIHSVLKPDNSDDLSDSDDENHTNIEATCYMGSTLSELVRCVPRKILKYLNNPILLNNVKLSKKKSAKKGKSSRKKATPTPAPKLAKKHAVAAFPTTQHKGNLSTYDPFDSAPTDLWNKMNTHEVVDLSGFEHFDQTVFDSTTSNKVTTTLVISQTWKMTDYAWLSKLESLQTICLRGLQLTEAAIQQIVKALPNLMVFRMEQCRGVDGRVMMYALRLPKLKQLILCDDKMVFQEHLDHGRISDKEWKTIKSDTLELVSITSAGLTLDVIAYLLQAAPAITNMILHDGVLSKVHDSHKEGFVLEDQGHVTFRSVQTKGRGFRARKPVVITNLLKDLYEAKPFSDSMVNLVHKKHPKWKLDDILPTKD